MSRRRRRPVLIDVWVEGSGTHPAHSCVNCREEPRTAALQQETRIKVKRLLKILFKGLQMSLTGKDVFLRLFGMSVISCVNAIQKKQLQLHSFAPSCFPVPANLPSSCCATGLVANDHKELRVSRKHRCRLAGLVAPKVAASLIGAVAVVT